MLSFRCINGVLKAKTRVLVTHHLSYLEDVDYIYIMNDVSIQSFHSLQSGVNNQHSVTHQYNTDIIILYNLQGQVVAQGKYHEIENEIKHLRREASETEAKDKSMKEANNDRKVDKTQYDEDDEDPNWVW